MQPAINADTLPITPNAGAASRPDEPEQRSSFIARRSRRLRQLRRALGERRFLGHPVAGAVQALGQRFLGRLAQAPAGLAASATAIPERMHLAANQARLVLELLEDVRNGNYRELPWRSVAIASAAVLYSISPADVVPDVIPVLGALDDIALLTIAVRLIQRDLRAYCRSKGYREADYFEVARGGVSRRASSL